MDAQRVLTQKGLAAMLGVDRKTIYNWHQRGIGPPRSRVVKRYYYSLEAVRAWFSRLNDSSLRSLASAGESPIPDRLTPTDQSPHRESGS